MGVIQKFTTAGIAPDKRLRYWNTIADGVFSGTYVNAENGRFAGEMFHWGIGKLNMIRTNSQSSAVGRPGVDWHEEHLILHLQCRGTALYRQAGIEDRLEPGDFAIGSSHLPYSFDLSAHEMLVVEFPRQPLADRLPGLDDHISQRIRGSSPGGRMFLDFMLSLWRQGGQQPQDPAWGDSVNGVFYDLAALAIRGAESGTATPYGQDLRRRALTMVESRLSDPGLRTTSLAQDLGLSVRTLQNLFAAMGTTPMGYIVDRRLERAAERLMADPTLTITQAAFDHGFSDAGYFTRCFRQKFGAPPRGWRRGK